MNKNIYKYIWLMPLFVFIQIYILNQVLFNGYINPYFYIMLIICLPQITPKWFLIIFGFFLGLSIDLFSGSLGFHSTSCILISFLKPSIEKIIIPKNTISNEQDILMERLGFKMFSIYAFIMISIHHIILFILAHFRISSLENMLGKVFLSSIITFIIIIISQFFFFKPERR
jgi:rod shape-determining protein MreD|tara:strand:- start:2377 stop:2892 length:516 start_codon:yes stop_codon:yes gene_type:complete